MCISVQAFAAGTSTTFMTQSDKEGLVSRTVDNSVGLDERLYDTTYNGQAAQRKVIKDLNGTVLFDAYVVEQNNIRTVYGMENGEVISKHSVPILKERISLHDAPSAGFSLIMSVPHPKLDITGNLYGKHFYRYGSYYKFSWSAGTKFALITERLIAYFGGSFNVSGLLVSLGVAVVGGVVDGVLAGKVRYKYDTWNYEVWAWNELGLRSEKVDVYEQIYDSKGNFVEDIFAYSDGDARSLKDITIAGAYNVYLWHV